MAEIQLFRTRQMEGEKTGTVNVSVEFTGTFTHEEWAQFQAVFHRMRTAKAKRLPEPCIEAEVIPPVRHLP